MKIEDLMVGDWVLYESKPVQIKCFGLILSETNEGLVQTQKCEPIHLSNEILEKNGFIERLINEVFYESISGRFITRQDDFYYMDGIIAVELRYVHELQHALRLLKIDKEIEL